MIPTQSPCLFSVFPGIFCHQASLLRTPLCDRKGRQRAVQQNKNRNQLGILNSSGRNDNKKQEQRYESLETDLPKIYPSKSEKGRMQPLSVSPGIPANSPLVQALPKIHPLSSKVCHVKLQGLRSEATDFLCLEQLRDFSIQSCPSENIPR